MTSELAADLSVIIAVVVGASEDGSDAVVIAVVVADRAALVVAVRYSCCEGIGASFCRCAAGAVDVGRCWTCARCGILVAPIVNAGFGMLSKARDGHGCNDGSTDARGESCG